MLVSKNKFATISCVLRVVVKWTIKDLAKLGSCTNSTFTDKIQVIGIKNKRMKLLTQPTKRYLERS